MYLIIFNGSRSLTKWMKPAAVSHVLMKIEHRFTSFIELLLTKRAHIMNYQVFVFTVLSQQSTAEMQRLIN